jgi:hypothetical protein
MAQAASSPRPAAPGFRESCTGILVTEGVRFLLDLGDRASGWLGRLRMKPAAIGRPVEQAYLEGMGRN